jgi:hypothetical protein
VADRDRWSAVRARLATARPWLLVATLALGAAGWAFAGLLYGAPDAEARALRLAGGLAAATVAAPAWYLLVARRGRHTLARGAAAAAVAGVLSHPVFWSYALALTEAAKGRRGPLPIRRIRPIGLLPRIPLIRRRAPGPGGTAPTRAGTRGDRPRPGFARTTRPWHPSLLSIPGRDQ